VNKRQLITLWITGIAISIIALTIVADWEHTKYPFYLFITASVPLLIIGALLYYTFGNIEHPLRWFHRLHRRRKIFIVILILLSATFFTILSAWTLGDQTKQTKKKPTDTWNSFFKAYNKHTSDVQLPKIPALPRLPGEPSADQQKKQEKALEKALNAL
jgi:uncharacterized membrane protein